MRHNHYLFFFLLNVLVFKHFFHHHYCRLPSLDTVESTMKCSALVVQALWDKASPLLQLPHVEEDMLKHFYSKRRNIKSLKQLAMMADEDRRSLLRSLTDDQYKDLLKVNTFS